MKKKGVFAVFCGTGALWPRVFAAALALMLFLSGCSPVSLTPVQIAEDALLPDPAAFVPQAPMGDSRAERSSRVTFYIINQEQQQLSALSRMLRLSGDDTLYERVIERMISGSVSAGLPAVAPEGTELVGYELSQNILTLNLSVDALAADAQALCWMRAALTNTLTGLPGVSHVNVLIDGKEESALTLPTGALGSTDGNLTALWAQQLADEERFAEDPASAMIERDATLYFGAWLDNRLLPEIRSVTLTDRNYAERLLNELRKGPEKSGQAHSVLPKNARLMRAPEDATLEDGRRVVRISFKEDLYALLEQSGLSACQLFASMTLSICRFAPELSGIMVGVGGELVTATRDGLNTLTFPDGVMTPGDFDFKIGRVARLYFPDGNGGLLAVDRVMDRASAVSPRALLEQLIAGPYVFDGGARRVVPEGVTAADALGIRVEDSVALVNFSSNFYRLCQELEPDAERNLIYSIVNTLCEMDGISSVRFYVAGETVDSLSQSICLLGPLMPNPGMVNS